MTRLLGSDVPGTILCESSGRLRTLALLGCWIHGETRLAGGQQGMRE